VTDPAGEDGLIVCGRIGRAHGLRGEVIVEAWTDTPAERFASGAALHTEPAGVGPLTVATARPQSGRWIVQFAEVPDRTAAEALRGAMLLVHRTDRTPIDDPDEFYDSDLIGLAVHTASGALVGRVSEVVHGPAGDLLAVDAGDREHLVPFVAPIVPTVDIAGGTVVINPPEGLLDL
jgi:16S rRNA processing protein RimM